MADFVKNDADGYIYVIADGALQIVDGWPPEQSQVLVRFPLDDDPKRLFVDGARLLVLSSPVRFLGSTFPALPAHGLASVRNPPVALMPLSDGGS